MYGLGLDLGYSSFKATLIDESGNTVFESYELHSGKIREKLESCFSEIETKFGASNIEFGAVTGSGAELLSLKMGIEKINEISSIIEGCTSSYRNIGSIIEIGGQTAKYITGIRTEDEGKIEFSINGNCASGTGTFLEEQVNRLNLNLEDYSSESAKSKTIPRIAGRCSVFAKTDIIHHQQEGVPVADILNGLAYSLVRNYRGAVMKKLPMKKPIAFLGGVGKNRAVIKATMEILELEGDELYVPENSGNVASKGAAKIAMNSRLSFDFMEAFEKLSEIGEVDDKHEVGLAPLAKFGVGDGENRHVCVEVPARRINCYMGIDVGSTSTNLVLLDESGRVISYKYLRTLGDPEAAVRKGLAELKVEFGDRAEILGVTTTGSGRYMIGDLVGADIIKDEITSQARAAMNIDPEVDTIFEIGGQDSKYISCEGGIIRDFEMNKICAAGTGSFIEEQAKKLSIPVEKIGEIAMKAEAPVDLGERCTVFIETNIATSLSRGEKIEDIIAGLCYSIAKNYLNRVVGHRKIGKKVVLQGGVAYNQGILNAFRYLLGDKISVTDYFSVTGAYGAALIAKEEFAGTQSSFKGFELDRETVSEEKAIACEKSLYSKVDELFEKGYDGNIVSGRKTVGIPRVLFLHKLFPMFNGYFKALGLNVVLSENTSESTIALSQEYSTEDACYPIKLIHGHVAELLGKKVDYIFMPSLYTMKHSVSKTRQNYGCVYMQTAPALIEKNMRLYEKGVEMLSPALSLNFGKKYMIKTMIELGKKLGFSTIKTARAMQKGMMTFKSFEKSIEVLGKNLVENLDKEEKAFVIITRTYGAVDPVLNMSIPEKIRSMGYKVITLSNLPAHDHDTSLEHPNMYWPFGQHIISGAQIVAEHPNLYAIHLTNHGCGPDTAITHYFKEAMGDKPYLSIEVDEHSSSTGVITRVEAFINSVKNHESEKQAKSLEECSKGVKHIRADIDESLDDNYGKEIYMKNVYPYSRILRNMLKSEGLDIKLMDITDQTSIDIGRQYTVSKEYLSLTAAIGDAMKLAEKIGEEKKVKLLIPTCEGSEVDGQYSRIIRSKLDEKGFQNIGIVSPFIEDTVKRSMSNDIFKALLAGDIVMSASRESRDRYLETIEAMALEGSLEMESLKKLAENIAQELDEKSFAKEILAVGEPAVLYSDRLNNYTIEKIERENRVRYAPMSEYIWLIWKDYLSNWRDKSQAMVASEVETKLESYGKQMKSVSDSLGRHTSFEDDILKLESRLGDNLRFYSGGNGKYRLGKQLGNIIGIDGILTLSSMYENTSTILSLVNTEEPLKSVINMAFDGNINRNDETKIESFLYYL